MPVQVKFDGEVRVVQSVASSPQNGAGDPINFDEIVQAMGRLNEQGDRNR